MAKSCGDEERVIILSKMLDEFDYLQSEICLDEKNSDRFESRMSEEDKLAAVGNGLPFTATFRDKEYEFKYTRRKGYAIVEFDLARMVQHHPVTIGKRFLMISMPNSCYQFFVIPENITVRKYILYFANLSSFYFLNK